MQGVIIVYDPNYSGWVKTISEGIEMCSEEEAVTAVISLLQVFVKSGVVENQYKLLADVVSTAYGKNMKVGVENGRKFN